jgi:hypothetical protein
MLLQCTHLHHVCTTLIPSNSANDDSHSDNPWPQSQGDRQQASARKKLRRKGLQKRGGSRPLSTETARGASSPRGRRPPRNHRPVVDAGIDPLRLDRVHRSVPPSAPPRSCPPCTPATCTRTCRTSWPCSPSPTAASPPARPQPGLHLVRECDSRCSSGGRPSKIASDTMYSTPAPRCQDLFS